MVSTVQSVKAALTVSCMRASLAVSTLLVASSSTSTLALRRSARAMHSSWRCPELRLLPASPRTASSPPYVICAKTSAVIRTMTAAAIADIDCCCRTRVIQTTSRLSLFVLRCAAVHISAVLVNEGWLYSGYTDAEGKMCMAGRFCLAAKQNRGASPSNTALGKTVLDNTA